ncbi:very-long-chain 3-oxoacyl-CoA reductase-like protein At1g24470 [Miscanthus floridulus]|uniref:very-long-chain 3-oxoacyl-CoA reductase-like protein At1g24470 n=1 Tax=Miscanthus floridulus TaxID=154761 RepID=UPI003458C664
MSHHYFLQTYLQVPLYVETNVVSSAAKNSLFPLFVVGPDACALAAVRWIGHGPLCVPNLVHQLQWWAAAFLPEILGDTCRLALHLHQRAIFRMLRSSRAHPQGNGGSSVDKFY